MICAKCGRNNSPRSNDVNGDTVHFFSVPSYPAPLTAPTLSTFIKQEGKILLRRYVLDRAGLSKDYKGKKYICNNHNFEWVKKSRDNMEWRRIHSTVLAACAQGRGATVIDN